MRHPVRKTKISAEFERFSMVQALAEINNANAAFMIGRLMPARLPEIIRSNVKKLLTFCPITVANPGLMITHCFSRHPGDHLKKHLKFIPIF